MLGLASRLLLLDWRRRGARMGEVDVGAARVWYAEFAPTGETARARGRLRGRRTPPTVVLLHGLGSSSASFFPVIGALRASYRVVVPDLPGYGWSRVRGRGFLSFGELVSAAEAFVERVAPGGAYLAGNSMGGWIAAKLAARRPDLARGIALLNPGGPALNAEDWVDLARVVSGADAAALGNLAARIFATRPLSSGLVGRHLNRLLQAPPVVHLMSTLTADDFVSEEELARVECPAVLIWGESDRFIPEACRAFFLEKLPRVRHEPLPDCGHCPQLECPRKTAEILLRLPRLRRATRPVRRRARGARADPRPAPRNARPRERPSA